MSTEQPSIVLYDIPRNVPAGQGGSGWSPNTLKSRIALNYKGIPFTTEWVEYPDIAPKFKALGLAPNPEGTPYTAPVIRYTPPGSKEGQYTMDSSAIADFLDRTFPARALYRGSPQSQRAQREFRDLIQPCAYVRFRAFVLHGVASQLHPVSEAYFRGYLVPVYGPLDQLLTPRAKYDEALAHVVEGFNSLSEFVDREEAAGNEVLYAPDEEGVRAPTYAGMVFTGVLEWLHRAGGQEAWEDIINLNGGRWAQLWKAVEPYARD
ncbi:hypothetical protein BS47DRAFT_1387833 [Hydnum rufescens UP504]|uniref:GST N-terminal domain-containing protein n=1 Tax=Hydnum rufescens UP504 TaxID=1448309 RepID=A0A9P6B8V5_9AGAM|nr:hypothetical protein BS47DRAFT_1387833 [Hydnum rufescens UP504]